MCVPRPLVVAATLCFGGTAVAGDSWSLVGTEGDVVYEEVGDGIFMPKGQYESLAYGDELLALIEKDHEEAVQKPGDLTTTTTTRNGSGCSACGFGGGYVPPQTCTTTTTTIEVPTGFSTVQLVVFSTTSCQDSGR